MCGGKFKMSLFKKRVVISFILIFVISLAAFSALKIMKSMQKKPARKASIQNAAIYSAVKAVPDDHVMKVQGFGTVVPSKTVSLIPEVSGRAQWVNDNFKKGSFLEKGEKIIEIDKTKYDIQYRTQKAAIDRLQSELALLRQEKTNLEKNHEILARELEIQEREFKRHQNLIKTKAISSAQLDASNLQYIKSQSAEQTVKNSLAVLPVRIEILEKQIVIEKTKLEDFARNLENTIIYNPFDGLVKTDLVEQGELVSAGKSIGSVYSIKEVEVPVSFDLQEAMWAMNFKNPPGRACIDNFTNISDRFGKLEVRVMGVRSDQVWPALVVRADPEVDPLTRTMRIIAGIKDPFKLVMQSKGPPLKPGVFVSVDFFGKVLKGSYQIPAFAVTEADEVMVLVPHKSAGDKAAGNAGAADKGAGNKAAGDKAPASKAPANKDAGLIISGTLDIRKVEIARRYSESVFITKGLDNGEMVIITPVASPVQGMKIRVIEVAQ
jgi:multidrug efflux pump subunit AcrA (membrane-fusion protein)